MGTTERQDGLVSIGVHLGTRPWQTNVSVYDDQPPILSITSVDHAHLSLSFDHRRMTTAQIRAVAGELDKAVGKFIAGALAYAAQVDEAEREALDMAEDQAWFDAKAEVQ